MSDYIDLEPQVSDYYGTTPGQERRAGICDALRYLDSHPDQVPGRTITESESRDLFKTARRGLMYWPDALERTCITVVPDPEPTNAEKLELVLEAFDADGDALDLSEYLDAAGVTAPGGHDE